MTTKKKVTKKKPATPKPEVEAAPSVEYTNLDGEPIEDDVPDAEDLAPAAPEALAESLEKVNSEEILSQLLTKVTELTTTVERLKTENAELQKLGTQSPEDGGRRIVGGENAIELPQQQEPSPQDFAVFRSPYGGFRQKLIPGRAVYHGTDYHIVPPVFAEFMRGTCILYDKEQIEIMRGIEIENKQKGRPVFVEVRDALDKEQIQQAHSKPLAPESNEVTSLAEAITR